MFKFSKIVPAITCALILAACNTPRQTPVQAPENRPQPVTPTVPVEKFRAATFQDVQGWANDDLTQVWTPFLASCHSMRFKPEWKEVCNIARDVNPQDPAAIREYFESLFTPFQVINPDGTEQGLITGYYEPFMHGARQRGGAFQTPLFKVPADLLTIDLSSIYPELKSMRLRGKLVGNKVVPYASRAEAQQALAGNELVWVDDAVGAFFLEVQGSGRIVLDDSHETIRVAYADQNGYPYKSIGRTLIDKGELRPHEASAQGIREWIRKNPMRQNEILNSNPSVVFFKEEKLPDPMIGPKGAQGLPLTAQRSIAVDAKTIPLGAPVFLATTQPNSSSPLQRLMLAQDTGGAIRGAVRADFYWGSGPEAGEMAGRMKQQGSMWVLLPKGVK